MTKVIDTLGDQFYIEQSEDDFLKLDTMKQVRTYYDQQLKDYNKCISRWNLGIYKEPLKRARK